MIRQFYRLWRSRRGATAIQYGLLAALIAITIMTTLNGMGRQMNSTYLGINCKIADPTRRPTECPALPQGGPGVGSGPIM